MAAYLGILGIQKGLRKAQKYRMQVAHERVRRNRIEVDLAPLSITLLCTSSSNTPASRQFQIEVHDSRKVGQDALATGGRRVHDGVEDLEE